ncbi:hypothetical protein GALMADRAFT_264277 [Galerina marginata CBS 339.88]|uniref:Uncharacterized protein n=1 Tax=Galerina marginata (strain CBS 339.88) TaxID=685588 RepID=A0A067TQ31_GALM3|nr:hypothetical protein GALMADRAFT_264277 [Galerina marginata CBS 339.88]
MQKSLVGHFLGRRNSSQPTSHGATGGPNVPRVQVKDIVHIENILVQPVNDDLPFFDLPNEIFCLIFLHARNLSLIPTSRNLSARPIELTISHVCKLWRSISLNCPPMWDTFRYVVPKSPLVRVKDRFTSYIERSSSHPLDIWFNFRGDHGKARFKDHAEMFTVFLSQVDRWRRITILVDDNLSFIDVDLLKGLHPVNLEHFALFPQQAGYSRALFKPNTFTSGAPKLKSVRLITTSYSFFLPPLSNITTLRFEKPSYYATDIQLRLSTVMALLGLPTLENLSVSGIQIHQPVHNVDFKNVILKRLQDFRCGSKDMAQILSYIQAPCLHSLTLRNVEFPILDAQSAPELTNLILLNCRVSWPAFSDKLLFVASRITHLTVSETPEEGTFHLHALTTFGMTNCWPQLTTLSCNIQSLSRLDPYLELALAQVDQPFTVRVHQNLLDMWFERTPDLLPSVDGVCIIKSWDSDANPLVPWHWPYAEDRAEHPFDKSDYDPFRIISYH